MNCNVTGLVEFPALILGLEYHSFKSIKLSKLSVDIRKKQKGDRETERETERLRETERQRETERDRERQRETERQRDRERQRD